MKTFFIEIVKRMREVIYIIFKEIVIYAKTFKKK